MTVREVSDLLTTAEAAARQRLALKTIQKALRNGRLKGHKVGERGDWRIAIADFDEWVANGAPTSKQEEAQQ